jgi:hypothetical protein
MVAVRASSIVALFQGFQKAVTGGQQGQAVHYLQLPQAAPGREINNDPRWLQWLGQIDPLNGVTRQQLLTRAEHSGLNAM